METEVIVALIGLVGVVVTAFIGRAKLKRHKQENEPSRKNPDFAAFFHDWGNAQRELVRLFDETAIDRFLLFRCWNGIEDPKWTTAVYQLRSEGQADIEYSHFALDSDYQERLGAMRKNGLLHFKTETIEECSIKQIYLAEGVIESVWCHIETLDIESDKKAIVYFSAATHSEEGIDGATRVRCRVLAGILQGLAVRVSE